MGFRVVFRGLLGFFRVFWVNGAEGLRVYGTVGLWVCGSLGLWVCGSLGLWVCGSQGWLVYGFRFVGLCRVEEFVDLWVTGL